VQRLRENIAAADVVLSASDLRQIEQTLAGVRVAGERDSAQAKGFADR